MLNGICGGFMASRLVWSASPTAPRGQLGNLTLHALDGVFGRSLLRARLSSTQLVRREQVLPAVVRELRGRDHLFGVAGRRIKEIARGRQLPGCARNNARGRRATEAAADGTSERGHVCSAEVRSRPAVGRERRVELHVGEAHPACEAGCARTGTAALGARLVTSGKQSARVVVTGGASTGIARQTRRKLVRG